MTALRVAFVYYAGLVVLAALIHLPSYLSSRADDRLWGGRIITAGVLYLCLGGWLFGWKLGLANVLVLIVTSNFIVFPLDWVVHWVRPGARYRMGMSQNTVRRLRRAAQKLGIPTNKQPITPVRNIYPEDEPPN